MTILGALIFLTAALLGFGNLAGWWEVSWWTVAAIWPIAPLLGWFICLISVLVLAAVVKYLEQGK